MILVVMADLSVCIRKRLLENARVLRLNGNCMHVCTIVVFQKRRGREERPRILMKCGTFKWV